MRTNLVDLIKAIDRSIHSNIRIVVYVEDINEAYAEIRSCYDDARIHPVNTGAEVSGDRNGDSFRLWLQVKTWKRFFFESNQFFDNINGMEDWQRLRGAYPHKSDDQLLDAKEAYPYRPEAHRDKQPNYGFRMEHQGDRTLRDFFKANNMKLEP